MAESTELATKKELNWLKNQVSQINAKQNQPKVQSHFNIPVNWFNWILLSFIATVVIWAIVPAVSDAVTFGQTMFGVLVVTFFSWLIFRAMMLIKSLLLGRSVSLLALLPVTLTGWVMMLLVVTVLYLTWSKFAPDEIEFTTSVNELWETVSSFLPFGSLVDVFDGSDNTSISGSEGVIEVNPLEPDGFDSAQSTVDFNTIPSKEGRVVSTPIALLDQARDTNSLLFYKVEKEGRFTYNVSFDGSEVRQRISRKCWSKFPVLDTTDCNPVLDCRTGTYHGVYQTDCPKP